MRQKFMTRFEYEPFGLGRGWTTFVSEAENIDESGETPFIVIKHTLLLMGQMGYPPHVALEMFVDYLITSLKNYNENEDSDDDQDENQRNSMALYVESLKAAIDDIREHELTGKRKKKHPNAQELASFRQQINSNDKFAASVFNLFIDSMRG